MYQRRVKGYEAMGYTIADSPEQALVQVPMDLLKRPELPQSLTTPALDCNASILPILIHEEKRVAIWPA